MSGFSTPPAHRPTDPPSLSRRSFLGAVGLLALQAQDADRLRDPRMVQQRAPVTPASNEEVVKGIEMRLKCTCGCNLDIFTCRTTDFTCTYSPQLHEEVVALHEAGSSPDQIVTAFVDKYGEQILMAPPPVGFNLAGYLVPGIVVLIAGTILAMVLLRRQRAVQAAGREPEVGAAPGESTPPSGEDLEQLRRALSEVAD